MFLADVHLLWVFAPHTFFACVLALFCQPKAALQMLACHSAIAHFFVLSPNGNIMYGIAMILIFILAYARADPLSRGPIAQPLKCKQYSGRNELEAAQFLQ